jgi:hypothetical protein
MNFRPLFDNDEATQLQQMWLQTDQRQMADDLITVGRNVHAPTQITQIMKRQAEACVGTQQAALANSTR